MDRKPREWRAYFTAEASKKKRKDTVAYGVNLANITNRLGLQVAVKGALLKRLGTKLYVVTQKRLFDYFCGRIPADWTSDRASEWDVTFMMFEYTEGVGPDGRHELAYVETRRTTIDSFAQAIVKSPPGITRETFLARVKSKLT